ncbi:MAG: condensation domain-containing protein [Lachnospiraceae bacterium]
MPENELQNQIYDCIAAVLGHRRFGIDTELYEAGLDSLGSVLLLTDLYQILKISMTLNDLLQHASVLKLEKFAQEGAGAEQVDYTVRQVYPLTNLQLYFAYVMRGNTTANLPFLYKLDKRTDLRRLKFAAEQLFEVHPELKAIIQMAEGRYQIFRDDKRKIDIPIVRLSDVQWEETRKGLLYPYLYGEGENLFHIGIYETDSANYFFFDIAHIMGDGMTMNVLFEDLNQLYLGKAVEPETYTFYEYILDEKDRDARGLRTKNEAYFRGLMKDFKVRKSILTRKDCYSLEHGVDADLKGRFTSLNRRNVSAFCKKLGVSENVFFLTAYNLSIGLFSNEKDTVSSSIHSGRTDSRWNRLAGPLFLTYFFRNKEGVDQTVPELLKTNAKQIMDTMRCYISNLHADEMFFQYQGDILNIDTVGGYPAERLRMQLDSLPFHLQVFTDAKGYYYELRYWENRFDTRQLQDFLTVMESLMDAMQEETLVRRLSRRLPDRLFPLHYTITVEELNQAAKGQLVTGVDGKEPVKVYVFDENCRKKPFGAWGSCM